MTTRARRITIEVGGEDTGASKLLKGTGQEADKLGSKMKAFGDKAGKNFAGGLEGETDKLASKMKTFGSKIGDNLSRGIDSGTSKIGSSMESAGSAAGDAFSSGFDINTIADTLASGFGSLSGKIGTAAAGAGVAASAAFAVGLLNGFEVEATTDRLAAQVGGGQWGATAGRIAGDLYGDAFGDSIADTGQVVRAVMTSNLVPFGANEQAIYDIAEAAATFSDVMDQDATASVTAVDRMIANRLVPNAESGFDILTTGLQELGPAGEDLLDTFTEYSIQFAALGLDAETALGMINGLMNAGVRNTDIAADALKEFGIRAIDASDATVGAFQDLGLNADDMMQKIAAGGPGAVEGLNQTLRALQGLEDPVERNRLGVELFGTQWEELKGTIATADLSAGAADLGEIAGRTADLGSAYDNASTKIETFRRQAMEKLTVFVADKALPVLEDFGRWAQDNPGKVVAVAVAIGTLTAAFVAAKIATVAWTFATTAWTVATTIATAAQWAFNTAIFASPVGWIILAIVGLIAIIVLLVIHWDKVKAAAGAAWDWIKARASDAWNWIATNWPLILGILTGPFRLATLAIVRNWDTIKQKGGQALQWIKDKATGAKDWVVARFGDIVSWVAGMGSRISGATIGMFGGITSAFKAAINSIISMWNGIRFPSLTIGGGDPLGSFGPSLPRVTIGGWDLPNIPMLAQGAVVRATPGGSLVNVGEGRHDEAVVPLDGNHGVGGDTTVININQGAFAGAIISSESDAERWVVAVLDRAIARGNGPTNRGRRIG